MRGNIKFRWCLISQRLLTSSPWETVDQTTAWVMDHVIVDSPYSVSGHRIRQIDSSRCNIWNYLEYSLMWPLPTLLYIHDRPYVFMITVCWWLCTMSMDYEQNSNQQRMPKHYLQTIDIMQEWAWKWLMHFSPTSTIYSTPRISI